LTRGPHKALPPVKHSLGDERSMAQARKSETSDRRARSGRWSPSTG